MTRKIPAALFCLAVLEEKTPSAFHLELWGENQFVSMMSPRLFPAETPPALFLELLEENPRLVDLGASTYCALASRRD